LLPGLRGFFTSATGTAFLLFVDRFTGTETAGAVADCFFLGAMR
jgi:hypothetical protein